jgi:hypothetical protein
VKRNLSFPIKTSIPVEDYQLDLLEDLFRFSTEQIIDDIEIKKDPRKIFYKSNQEFQYSLVSMFLACALINEDRRVQENKPFFVENITVHNNEENQRIIDFGAISVEYVFDAINPVVIEDWKTYRDKRGLGIKSLIDKKTHLVGLKNFVWGGDPIYEFARFYRKYHEVENEKKIKEQEKNREAFRSSVISSMAKQYTEQQLLSGANPFDVIDNLLGSNDSSHSNFMIEDKTKKKKKK